jgi:hypothetical protein
VPGTLLTTKLRVPAAPPRAVPRPHLMERLDEGLTRKLTLLSAPPGFGKTTLLGQWISLRSEPVAWLSLDGADNDLTRFLSYLVAALQSIQPGLGRAHTGLPPRRDIPNPALQYPGHDTAGPRAVLPVGVAEVLEHHPLFMWDAEEVHDQEGDGPGEARDPVV